MRLIMNLYWTGRTEKKVSEDATHRKVWVAIRESISNSHDYTEWFNLFIDLIWVGIVSNIGEAFLSTAFESENSKLALGLLEFLILFLTAWRIWNSLRKGVYLSLEPGIQLTLFAVPGWLFQWRPFAIVVSCLDPCPGSIFWAARYIFY